MGREADLRMARADALDAGDIIAVERRAGEMAPVLGLELLGLFDVTGAREHARRFGVRGDLGVEPIERGAHRGENGIARIGEQMSLLGRIADKFQARGEFGVQGYRSSRHGERSFSRRYRAGEDRDSAWIPCPLVQSGTIPPRVRTPA